MIRIFTCSSTLGAKLQIVKYKLMYEPIEKALKNMHVDLSDVNQIFRLFLLLLNFDCKS